MLSILQKWHEHIRELIHSGAKSKTLIWKLSHHKDSTTNSDPAYYSGQSPAGNKGSKTGQEEERKEKGGKETGKDRTYCGVFDRHATCHPQHSGN